MTNPIYVSHERWRDGLRFLMGLGATARLSYEDQHKLRAGMRGEFGMSEVQAASHLRRIMGWETRVQRPADRFVVVASDEDGNQYWWNGIDWSDHRQEAALMVEQVAVAITKKHGMPQIGMEKVQDYSS